MHRIITIYIIYNHLSFPRQKQGLVLHLHLPRLRFPPRGSSCRCRQGGIQLDQFNVVQEMRPLCDRELAPELKLPELELTASSRTHGQKDLFEVADVDLVFNDVVFFCNLDEFVQDLCLSAVQ